jgi:hypothetical protein
VALGIPDSLMLAFTFNRKSRNRTVARPETAGHRLDLGDVDRRPVVKKYKFADVFRYADDEAEREMMNPRPSPQFRRFFAQFAQPRRVPTVEEQRMDASFPSASGARLVLLI